LTGGERGLRAIQNRDRKRPRTEEREKRKLREKGHRTKKEKRLNATGEGRGTMKNGVVVVKSRMTRTCARGKELADKR